MRLSPISLPFEGKTIYQDTASQGVSTASQILFDKAITRFENAPMRVLELGAGCGIVSIMAALARPLWQITAIEIQPALAELACSNIKACGLQIELKVMDLCIIEGQYDLILANPPWRKAGSGHFSANHSRNLSRFELACTLEDVLKAVKRCLVPGGTAILLYPAERNAEIVRKAEKTFLDIIKQEQELGKKAYTTSYIQHRNDDEDEIFSDHSAAHAASGSLGISGT